jgi:hypothetical protein
VGRRLHEIVRLRVIVAVVAYSNESSPLYNCVVFDPMNGGALDVCFSDAVLI